jgi:hypothetical protein
MSSFLSYDNNTSSFGFECPVREVCLQQHLNDFGTAFVSIETWRFLMVSLKSISTYRLYKTL